MNRETLSSASLHETAQFAHGGKGFAGMVVEESAVEPAGTYLVVAAVLLGEPPEESRH